MFEILHKTHLHQEYLLSNPLEHGGVWGIFNTQKFFVNDFQQLMIKRVVVIFQLNEPFTRALVKLLVILQFGGSQKIESVLFMFIHKYIFFNISCFMTQESRKHFIILLYFNYFLYEGSLFRKLTKDYSAKYLVVCVDQNRF